MEEYYLWIKSFHIISVTFWMAGLLYLPRLFVYHCEVPIGGDQDKIFQTMEKKLLSVIMNPAMIFSLIFGLLLAYIYGFKNLGVWFHIKFTLVLIMIYFHHFLAKVRKGFEQGRNKYKAKFFRCINEIPAILMIFITVLVIIKPF